MPFYHAQEATAAIKKVLGPYYNADKTPVPLALFRSWRTCKFVDPSDGPIMWYYNMRSLSKKNS
jgi:omega-6 fatty acid desaturase / acyl-lipid omega-6 desaturase (Delta-12 desaturase)